MSQQAAAPAGTQAVGTGKRIGRVVSVIGPVLDIEFGDGHLPPIFNAVRIAGEVQGQAFDIITEVEQHLGENRVRTVAMKPTDRLQGGREAVSTGCAARSAGSRCTR